VVRRIDPRVVTRRLFREPDADGALGEPVEVEIVDSDGRRTLIAIGVHPEHGVVAEIEGRRSVLEKQDLHAALLRLFG